MPQLGHKSKSGIDSIGLDRDSRGLLMSAQTYTKKVEDAMDPVAVWTGPNEALSLTQSDLLASAHRVRSTTYVVVNSSSGKLGDAQGGATTSELSGSSGLGTARHAASNLSRVAWRSQLRRRCTEFASPTSLVPWPTASARPMLWIAMARAGMLGFFGAAGLSPQRVVEALDALEAALGRADDGGLPWGSNLIHSPNEPAIEEAVADLYLRRGVRRVSAAAYMSLSAPIVRYGCTGLSRGCRRPSAAQELHLRQNLSPRDSAALYGARSTEDS